VSGGIDVPVKLGSRSTYTLGALGGHEGRALKAGDSLPLGQGAGGKGAIPAGLRRMPGNPAELRMLPGLYWHRITAGAGKQFFADTWKVAPEADRIGYRFKGGTALDFVPREQPFGAGSNPSNIVDACYPYGSVQVPSGTEPIVLHRDAVSGGGYMMLGCVISADMDLIGQLQPHSPARFVEVTMDQALAARADRKAALAALRAHLGRSS
jgi:allophanate hydrolase subunit 2